ncbi:hypothetical protein B0A48_07415 [Cryoendolithus antarcticus]|uniref:Enoyl reductase (ER) domain-containing protein n=1 Tax=Cryoendolithus antarcticus TaxID=1507870 RepID=A0A1V8T909_9PEZI|nr:hypothetical protein B0A48_07415 [Cryoendolithus antarcticus]
MSNQAAWLDGKGKDLRVAEAELPSPGADQVVIKAHALAINPVDWKIQDYGFFVQTWPAVLGEDIAGEIYEVGSNVTRFKKGDRVIAHAHGLVTGDPKDGSLQLYPRAFAKNTTKLPDSISFTEGSVLPLAINTAADGLYKGREDGFLGLELPTLTPTASGKTLVVYGGSSSVGAIAIQLAVASGATVIATASSHNHDFVAGLGASKVLDYKKSSIVDDVVEAVKSTGSNNFIGIYDAISLPDSYKNNLAILEKLGTGNLATTLPGPKAEELPKGSKTGGVFAISPVTAPLWEDGYITQALEQGKLKAVPEPLVVGKGLDSVQKGFAKQKEGVSAKKVVIEL